MAKASLKMNRPAKRERASRNPRKSSRVLGVDFGSHTLKLAEVEHGPLGPVIRTFGVSPYIKTRQGQPDLVSTLEELTRMSRTRAKDVLLTLPPIDMFMVDREFPYQDEPKQDQIAAVQIDLKNHLINNLVNRSVIWPLKPQIDRTQQLLRYNFATVPNQVVDLFKSVVDTAGLNLAGLQYAPHALGKALARVAGAAGTSDATETPATTTPSRTAILDLGAQSTGWYVYDNGHLVQKAILPYGSEALTKALALANGWDTQKAEEHKRSLTGPTNTWPATSALVVETFLKNWWQDLIDMLAETPTYLERIILIGGGARFTPLKEFIFDKFGLLPENWSLPKNAHVSEELRQYLDPQLPVLVNSLALLVNA